MNLISSFFELINKEQYLKIIWIIIILIILIVPSTSIIFIYRPNLFFVLDLAKLLLLILVLGTILSIFIFLLLFFKNNLVVKVKKIKLTSIERRIYKEFWIDECNIKQSYKAKEIAIINLKARWIMYYKKIENCLSPSDLLLDTFSFLLTFSLIIWIIKLFYILLNELGQSVKPRGDMLTIPLLLIILMLGLLYIFDITVALLKKDSEQKELECLFKEIANT